MEYPTAPAPPSHRGCRKPQEEQAHGTTRLTTPGSAQTQTHPRPGGDWQEESMEMGEHRGAGWGKCFKGDFLKTQFTTSTIQLFQVRNVPRSSPEAPSPGSFTAASERRAWVLHSKTCQWGGVSPPGDQPPAAAPAAEGATDPSMSTR